MNAFEKSTLHRLCSQAARFWVLASYLETKKLPDETAFFAYANGPGGFDWGNPPGPDDPDNQPLRRKRVRITLTIEDA